MSASGDAPPAGDRPAGERLAPLGLIVSTINQLPQLFVPIVAALYGTRDSELGAVPVIAVVLVLSLFFRWLVWTRFRYTVGEDDIHIERGLISRSARSVPYDRIADVSIEQPALARMLGLAVVRFETGGGKGDEAELSFVSEPEAERLRETVRSRKAGQASPATVAADEGHGEAPAASLLFAMDLRRIMILGLYSFSLVVFALLLGLAGKFDFLLPDLDIWIGLAESRSAEVESLSLSSQAMGILAALAVLIVLGIGTGVGRTLLREYGFKLERTAKGLRRRRGLLTLTDMTIPVERVQGIEIGTGPVRSRSGWHYLYLISMADAGSEKFDQMVAPLAKLDEIWSIVREVGIAAPDPELTFSRAHFGPQLDRMTIRTLVLALIGLALVLANLPAGWLVILPIAGLALRDWLRWRGEWRAVDQQQLYMRAGWWSRMLVIARQINVHSVSISRGPLQRRRGLATLHFGIANGAMRFPALPLAEAQAIRAAVLAVVTPVDFSRLNQPH